MIIIYTFINHFAVLRGINAMFKLLQRSIFHLVCGALILTLAVGPVVADSGKVNIYSARKEALILPILEIFKEETGISFNLVTGKADELLKRIELEGQATPADLFITVDAGRLYRAKQAGVLQPISSEAVLSRVPEKLRDEDGLWVGLSMRARPIFYSKERVDPGSLSTYEQLTDEVWKGRICVRSSSNIYNQSLVASMIEANGAEKTLQWATPFVGNFARDPAGGDTDQIKSVAAGECDIGIANTYYYGRLAASDNPDNQAVAAAVGVFWPNQGSGDRGTHVNVSGAGITKHAKNRDNAIRLLEFLTTEDSQNWYAQVNHEYPVVPNVAPSSTLQAIGEFRADDVNMTALGANNRKAVEVMDLAGWK